MPFKKTIFSVALLVITLQVSAQDAAKIFKPDSLLRTMERVADWQLNSWATKSIHPKYDWTNAAGYAGFLEFAKLSKDNVYINYLVGLGNELHWQTGPRRYMADDYCIGQTYAIMYMMYNYPKMIANFKT